MKQNRSGGGQSPHERYKLLDIIGSGTFGQVYKGYDTVADRKIAVKVIDLDDVEEDIDQIQQEIAILKTCKSPNITEYYGAVLLPGTARLMIAMELLAASVADLLIVPTTTPTTTSPSSNNNKNENYYLPEPHIAYILREVLNALVYLHADHRIHRDIKAANILLSDQGAVKVSDFGVSAQLTGTAAKRRTFVGSPLWMAPEVIAQTLPTKTTPTTSTSTSTGDTNINTNNTTTTTNNNNNNEEVGGYDESVDIWSLGVTAIEMAEGNPPHSHLANIQALFAIVREQPPTLSSTSSKKGSGSGRVYSREFEDFVCLCLQKDPSQRPSAIDLLMHPFVGVAEKPRDMETRIAVCVDKKRRGNVMGGGGGGGGSALGGTVKAGATGIFLPSSSKPPPPPPLSIPQPAGEAAVPSVGGVQKKMTLGEVLMTSGGRRRRSGGGGLNRVRDGELPLTRFLLASWKNTMS